MSESDKPPEDWMVTFCSLPVALSLALTLTMPFASMSNVTSMRDTARAGGIPTDQTDRASCCRCHLRSPCNTLMPTGLLSAAVEKVWLFLVGMVVLRLIKRVNTPPRVSMPRGG